MAKLTSMKPVAAAVVASAISMAAQADTNPFAIKPVSSGLTLAQHHEGKCGEGQKCTCDKDDKKRMGDEEKCKHEGKCGGAKDESEKKEEKAQKEGKCGEGKCGGSMKKDAEPKPAK